MKEKIDFLDWQRNNLSNEEIDEIYSKESAKESKDSEDKTEEDKTLRKLGEELFSINSELEKNPNDTKLTEEYVRVNAEIKKLKEQGLSREKNLGELVSLKEAIENNKGLFDKDGINSNALESDVNKLIKNAEKDEGASVEDYPEIVKGAMELLAEEGEDSFKKSEESEKSKTVVENLIRKKPSEEVSKAGGAPEETIETGIVSLAEELGVELKDDFRKDVEKLEKIKNREADIDADFIEKFREKYLDKDDTNSGNEKEIRRETISLFLDVKKMLDEAGREGTGEPKEPTVEITKEEAKPLEVDEKEAEELRKGEIRKINKMLKKFRESGTKLRIKEGENPNFIVTEFPDEGVNKSEGDYVALKNVDEEGDIRTISRDALYNLNSEAVEFRKAVEEEIEDAKDSVVEKIIKEETTEGDSLGEEIKIEDIEKTTGKEAPTVELRKEIGEMSVGELDTEIERIYKIKEEAEGRGVIFEEIIKNDEYLAEYLKDLENAKKEKVKETTERGTDTETEGEPELEGENETEKEKMPEDLREAIEKLRGFEIEANERVADRPLGDKDLARRYTMGDKLLTPKEIEIAKNAGLERASVSGARLDTIGANMAATEHMTPEEARIESARIKEALEIAFLKRTSELKIESEEQKVEVGRRGLAGEKVEAVDNFEGAAKKGIKGRIKEPILGSGKKKETEESAGVEKDAVITRKTKLEEIPDIVQKANDFNELLRIAESLENRYMTKKSRKFLKKFRDCLNRLKEEGEYKGLDTELNEMRSDLDSKKFGEDGKVVLESFLDRVEYIRDNLETGEIPVDDSQEDDEVVGSSATEIPASDSSETKNETDKINPEIAEAEKKVVEFISDITTNVEQIEAVYDGLKKIKKDDNESFGKFFKKISNPLIKKYLEKDDRISEIKRMTVGEVFAGIEKYIKGKK
ncbi:MAG: hypothetical protein U9N04_04525 [Patescibacteria group bacterium]|nr:hypothetical protein [Patescibacteria group bacterium]